MIPTAILLFLATIATQALVTDYRINCNLK